MLDDLIISLVSSLVVNNAPALYLCWLICATAAICVINCVPYSGQIHNSRIPKSVSTLLMQKQIRTQVVAILLTGWQIATDGYSWKKSQTFRNKSEIFQEQIRNLLGINPKKYWTKSTQFQEQIQKNSEIVNNSTRNKKNPTNLGRNPNWMYLVFANTICICIW